MIKSIKQILTIFSPKERLKLLGVLLIILAMGIMQMAGVGLVMPFISLISNPDYIHHNAWLAWLYNALGFATETGFLLLVGGLLLVALIGSNILTALAIWVMTHFSWSVQTRISTRMLDGYLHQPYETFLGRNTADTGKNILQESKQFADGVLLPALRSLAFFITGLMIVGMLFWMKPLVALGVVAAFVGAYLLIYLTIRRLLLRIGELRMNSNTARFKAVNEAFGSIKEVKVLNQEHNFISSYVPAAHTFADTQAKQKVLESIPRFAIEGLGFGLVMGAMLFLLASGRHIADVLPVAGAFVAGGYRLLPALQEIYKGFTKWRFNQAVVNMLLRDLQAFPPRMTGADGVTPPASQDKLPFQNALEVKNLHYQYPAAAGPALSDVCLTIPRNAFVAFTGTTGAGKTTLVDMLLGLLQPQSGRIEVDGAELIGDNVRRWQANLGYVPQEIYLTDSTVAENIAYGVPRDAIDYKAVESAARIANIHDFIMGKLSDGYDSMVGERGVRLSGGQRQRIGIARALYRDPAVIVLDEATSALDNETERRIVNELDAMRGGRTLIVIAHRLTTVQKCHKVFLLKEGRVAASGTYDELVAASSEFSGLAQASQG